MFNNPERTYSGWCCTDCLMLLAYGETPADLTEDETAEYLTRVERHCEDSEVTLGMFREDHGCATNWTVTWHAPGSVRGSFRRGYLEVRADSYGDAMDAIFWAAGGQGTIPDRARAVMARSHELETEDDRGGECECERQSFSWSSCDVCGSGLGGAREAVVFWFGPASSDQSEDQPEVTSHA